MISTTDNVIASLDNNIGTITFFSEKANSLKSNQLELLSQKIDQLSTEASCKVIVLKSQGESTFCAGASTEEFSQVKNFEDAERIFSGFSKVIISMRNAKQLIITRVQGKVVGGGLGLVAASDYVFGLERAEVRLPELSVGIGPFVISQALIRRIGLNAFSEMSIDCEWKSSKWALEKGLYNKTYTLIEELDTNLNIFTSTLAAKNIESLKELKKLFWENTENWNTILKHKAKISANLLLSNRKD